MGLRTFDRSHHLERRAPGNFGLPASRFAHPDRIDHGRRQSPNALLRGRGRQPPAWTGRQAANIAKALLLSPLFGFALAALLLFVLKTVLQRATPALFAEPKGNQPPPWWIRGILILTCTPGSASFNGSNDGSKRAWA